jgi:DNA-binding MarR family transcriptional regulator
MPAESFSERDLQILEHIESNPDSTQSSLAEHLGVAVGTVNFVVRRMIDKGYIQVKRLERKRLKYMLTPQGIAIRAKLAMISIEYSMRLYRETRAEAKRLINKVRQKGFDEIAIRGEGELAEVVRLTCLEMGVDVVSLKNVPVLEIVGTLMELKFENF